MDSFIVYLILFSIIVILGQAFRKSTTPIALILAISGMLLSRRFNSEAQQSQENNFY